MNRLNGSVCGYLASVAALLVLLLPGCGKDDTVTSQPAPDLTLSLSCNGPMIDLALDNGGVDMEQESMFIVSYGDGEIDTLLLLCGSENSVTCRLSNIHGGVTVTNEEYDLTAEADDCLMDYLEAYLMNLDPGGMIGALPPISELGCTYTVTLNQIQYDGPFFDFVRTGAGLTLTLVYRNFRGNISGVLDGGFWCPQMNGSFQTTSVVINVEILIDEGGDPESMIGNTTVVINNLDVTIDSWLLDLIVSFIGDNLAGQLETGIEGAINSALGSDVSDWIVVNSSCAE